jgi:uncharacterized metal-binding protein YceD (DUF177 family)
VNAPAVLAALDAGGDELGQVVAVLRAAGEAEPESLDLGSGDRRLLEVLADVTGSAIEVTARCSRCLELNFAVVVPDSVPPSRPRHARLGTGGGLRQPTYADLADLPADDGDAARELLRRCVVGTPTRSPSAEHVDLVDDALTGPVRLECAGCGEPVEVELDVQANVIERLALHARTVDIEVHLLARAYHWSLAEITALPDGRRSALAQLVAEDQ